MAKQKREKYKEKNIGYNLQNHLNLLKDFKQDFQFENSNFTAKIITEKTQISFQYKELSTLTFIAYAKVLRDIKKSGLEKPKVVINDLNYFEQNLKEEQLNYVVNFDLTKAYPTILLNEGFITQDTYDFLCKINKTERLASIGMLARKKNTVIYQKGLPVYAFTERKDTSEYFFYLVDKTNKIMNEIRENVKSRFLFTWVDGIYFQVENDNEYSEAIQTVDFICKKYKMDYTVDVLVNYLSSFANGVFQVYFQKDEKEKRFSIPSNELRAGYNTYVKMNNFLKNK